MKQVLLKIVSCVFVFALSLYVFSMVMNQGNTDMTTEMGPATYPLVTFSLYKQDINRLHGYTREMEVAYLRDTITPLDEQRRLEITVDKYDALIQSVSYELRDMDGDRLIEDGTIESQLETDYYLVMQHQFKDLLDENTEYSFCLMLTLSTGETVYYYTHIVYAPLYQMEEKMEFVSNFHELTFDKENAEELTTYLETNSSGDNSTFSKVTINSSLDQVTWGDLVVTRVTQPDMILQEVQKETASIRMEYIASTTEGKVTTYYIVREYYRIRSGSDRVYLLAYERTLTQMFDEQALAITENRIQLGVVDKKLEMMESDGGEVVAFVTADQLYSYQTSDNKFVCLFSFYDGLDLRTIYRNHSIKILSVDEVGNIRFMVYGYMNRGKHEGEVGVQVNYYNALTNALEEEIFIPYTKSYTILDNQISQLAFVNKNGSFYLYLEDNIYDINLGDKASNNLITDLQEGSFCVSGSQEMLVWSVDNNLYENHELRLMNLSTKKVSSIVAGEGNSILALGFMGDDVIYGLARTEDIRTDSFGNITFPMHSVNIQNEEGKILKTYAQEGIYVTGGQITGNQLELTRVIYNEETDVYVETKPDHITSNELEKEYYNVVTTAATDLYGTITRLVLRKNVNLTTLKMLYPKEILFEGNRSITIPVEEKQKYYVYGAEGVAAIYQSIAKAVNHANEIAGCVINSRGEYVFVRANLSTRNQIMAITATTAKEGQSSLEVCLDVILQYEGIQKKREYFLDHSNTVVAALQSNLAEYDILDLSGCSLDTMLYYINRDLPVLALLEDGNAVLVVGFNTSQVVIMDPLTGTLSKRSKDEMREYFENQGNRFISYVRVL